MGNPSPFHSQRSLAARRRADEPKLRARACRSDNHRHRGGHAVAPARKGLVYLAGTGGVGREQLLAQVADSNHGIEGRQRQLRDGATKEALPPVLWFDVAEAINIMHASKEGRAAEGDEHTSQLGMTTRGLLGPICNSLTTSGEPINASAKPTATTTSADGITAPLQHLAGLVFGREPREACGVRLASSPSWLPISSLTAQSACIRAPQPYADFRAALIGCGCCIICRQGEAQQGGVASFPQRADRRALACAKRDAT